MSMVLQPRREVVLRGQRALLVAGLLAGAAVAGVALGRDPKLLVLAGLGAAGIFAVAKPRVGIAVLWVTGLLYGFVLSLVHGNTTLTLWK